MSTMAPARAAQLLFLLLMVILMVNGTPVRSLRISLVTSEEGVFVGKGPSVSVGEVVQVPVPPEPLPKSEPDAEEAFVSCFLQELTNGAMVAKPSAPMNPFFKKS